MSFANALKWSFLAELATKLVQPVVFIVLARLLAPEDFGVMTAALMVIAFSQIFWEAGMGKALIQRQTEIEAAANAAFWINLTLAVFISFLLYFSSAAIAEIIFQDERVTAVMQLMTLQVVLGSLGSVQSALLQKEMGFKKLFWIRFATVSLPGLVSIPLAWYGWSYWALVMGTLFGQLVQVFMLWRISKWRPHFGFDGKVAKDISRFGAWVGVTGFLVWFYQWADALVVGMYLGGHELGLYRMGNQLVSVVFALLLVPVMPVIYSVLSASGFDRERFGFAYNDLINKLVQIGVVLGGLVCAGFVSGGGGYFLGKNWHGVDVVAAFFGLIHGFAWIVGFNGEYYRASGRPQLETFALVISMPVYLLAYIYFASLGLLEFLYARLFLVFLGIAVHLFFISKILSVDFLRLGRNFSITVLVCALGLLVGFLLADSVEAGLARLLIIEVTAVLVILCGLLVFNRKEFFLILSSIFNYGK